MIARFTEWLRNINEEEIDELWSRLFTIIWRTVMTFMFVIWACKWIWHELTEVSFR